MKQTESSKTVETSPIGKAQHSIHKMDFKTVDAVICCVVRDSRGKHLEEGQTVDVGSAG